MYKEEPVPAIFIGQHNDKGEPDGLVRLITEQPGNWLLEGQVKNGGLDGLSRLIGIDSRIGYHKDNKVHGNWWYADYRGKIHKDESGYFEDDKRVGDHKKDEEGVKYFEIKDVVATGNA